MAVGAVAVAVVMVVVVVVVPVAVAVAVIVPVVVAGGFFVERVAEFGVVVVDFDLAARQALLEGGHQV